MYLVSNVRLYETLRFCLYQWKFDVRLFALFTFAVFLHLCLISFIYALFLSFSLSLSLFLYLSFSLSFFLSFLSLYLSFSLFFLIPFSISFSALPPSSHSTVKATAVGSSSVVLQQFVYESQWMSLKMGLSRTESFHPTTKTKSNDGKIKCTFTCYIKMCYYLHKWGWIFR